MSYVGKFGSSKFLGTYADGYLSSTAKGTSSDLLAGDGTVVTLGSGLTLSGGTLTGGGGGWQTTYEVDFTTLTPVASYSNGTATIDGKTWTFASLGANKTASLSAANGLQLFANTNSGNPTNKAIVELSQLGCVPFQNQALIWVRADRTVATSGTGDSLADIATGNDSLSTACPWLRFMYANSPGAGGVSGTAFYPFANLNGTNYPSLAYSGYTTSNTNHDVSVLQMISANLGQIWTGSWSSGWPLFSALQFRGYTMINASVEPGGASLTLPNPNAYKLNFGVASNGTAGSATMNIKNLRVQVK